MSVIYQIDAVTSVLEYFTFCRWSRKMLNRQGNIINRTITNLKRLYILVVAQSISGGCRSWTKISINQSWISLRSINQGVTVECAGKEHIYYIFAYMWDSIWQANDCKIFIYFPHLKRWKQQEVKSSYRQTSNGGPSLLQHVNTIMINNM